MRITNYVLAVTLMLLGLSCSQGHKNAGMKTSSLDANGTAPAWDAVDDQRDSGSLRRLESVTWDSVKHQLVWDVSKGERKGDSYRPRSNDRYAINMDDATMTVNGETRRFSEDEASNVRLLMDFISRYALESTVWWENGEGDPIDGKPAPERPEKQTPQRTPEYPMHEGKAKAIHIVEKIAATE